MSCLHRERGCGQYESVTRPLGPLRGSVLPRVLCSSFWRTLFLSARMNSFVFLIFELYDKLCVYVSAACFLLSVLWASRRVWLWLFSRHRDVLCRGRPHRSSLARPLLNDLYLGVELPRCWVCRISAFRSAKLLFNVVIPVGILLRNVVREEVDQ